MAKRVTLSGVEIYTSDENIPTDKFFDFVQEVIDALEAELSSEEKNFQLNLQFRFYPDQKPKHRIHLNGIKVRRMQEKIVKILRNSTTAFTKRTGSSVQIDMLVHDK